MIRLCGIAGIVEQPGTSPDPRLLDAMLESIKHRGPDDRGTIIEGNVALGNVRLSIIDLSPDGHMPMKSPCKDIWITHNGEVYNYLELRGELEAAGHRFKSKTDTEVILHAYEEWGEKCVERFNGMFAFAILDSGKLFCARDRFGKKPFYYFREGGLLVFASEIKALLKDDRVPRRPNDSVILDYLMFGISDHRGETFFDRILNLEPGHLLVFAGGKLEIRKWWSLDTALDPKQGFEEAAVETRRLLHDSVRLRLRSDVPVGTCLSGGIDSSSIVALMRDIAGPAGEIHSFSAVFPGHQIDESPQIALMEQRARLQGHRIEPKGRDLVEGLSKFIYHQDEPTRSSSQFAQWMVMELARKHGLKVLLDGQGGDEVFAGYTYLFSNRFYSLLRGLRLATLVREWRAFRRLHRGERSLSYLAAYLAPRSTEIRAILRRTAIDPRFAKETRGPSREAEEIYFGRDFRRTHLIHLDRKIRELLRYEDRSAMAFSIETRLPFLDHRLVRHATSLPSDFLMSAGIAKRILRQSMRAAVPDAILDRHLKIGFETPESEWFLDPEVRRVLEPLVLAETPVRLGYLDAEKQKSLWHRYLGKDRFVTRAIWRAVSLEQWFRLFLPREHSKAPFPPAVDPAICDSLLRGEEWAWRRGYRGWDPYDGIEWMKDGGLRRSPLVRRLVQQTVRLLPVDLRRLLGVRAQENPKTLALFASAYLNLFLVTRHQGWLHEGRCLLRRLAATSAPKYSNRCWGYPFDWQSANFYLPRGEPSSAVTCIVAHAFMDYHDAVQEPGALQVARSACDFILKDLHVTHDSPTEQCRSYTPFDKSRILNVNAMGASLLARVSKASGGERLMDTALRMGRFSAARQRGDGAWEYGEAEDGKKHTQVDFHHGTVVRHLYLVREATGDASFDGWIASGLKFYRDRMFTERGESKWRDGTRLPLDAHTAAEGIIVFASVPPGVSRMGDSLAFASRIAKRTIELLQSADGAFSYQAGRMTVKRWAFMRWSQAWMTHSLSVLVKSLSPVVSPDLPDVRTGRQE